MVKSAGWRRCFLLLILLPTLLACGAERRVVVEVDGGSKVIMTQATTVRQVLAEAGVQLGEIDRVEPDLWEEVGRSATIVVTRIDEETVVEYRTIPFERKVVKDEAVPEGEARMVQLGVNGQEVSTYLVRYEDGREVERQLLGTEVLEEPQAEVVLVGVQGSIPTVPIEGTVAYISNGNAWVMRQSSTNKRPLTFAGDLDGRVFDLSPDGRYLLFTRRPTVGGAAGLTGPLNSLWVVDTLIVGEEPRPLGLDGVLYGEWSFDGKRFAYSTAERTPGAPGWKAHNDLWIAPLDGGEGVQVLPSSSQQLYSWWGTTYVWSPDGLRFAYARPDEVGIIDLEAWERRPLLTFAPYHTYSEWVWTPTVTWSPDSRYLATVVHGPPLGDETPEESKAFDIWVLSVDGQIQAQLVSQAGMWASPTWSPPRWDSSGQLVDLITYGQAQYPADSQNCRYDLYVMDGDGSNRRQLFPFAQGGGLAMPQTAWSPQGDQLIVEHEGNLYLVGLHDGGVRALTRDGASSYARWSQ